MSYIDIDKYANRKEVKHIDFKLSGSRDRIAEYSDGYMRLFSIRVSVKKSKKKEIETISLGVEIGGNNMDTMLSYLSKIYKNIEVEDIEKAIHGS